jgi:hypothetical protein
MREYQSRSVRLEKLCGIQKEKALSEYRKTKHCSPFRAANGDFGIKSDG